MLRTILSIAFSPLPGGDRTIICSREAIRHSGELGGQYQPKTDIVIAVRRMVVIAIGNAAVLRIIVPVAAAQHAIMTLR